MPDFQVRVTGGAALATWSDAPTAQRPSRLNHAAAHPPKYHRAIPPATVTVAAVVGGVVGPLDAALGGRLFLVSWAEWSGQSPAPIAQAPGASSSASVSFGAQHLGHHLLLFWREGGGAVAVPIEVEET